MTQHLSPEFLIFVAIALIAIALTVRMGNQDEAHRDARRRNPGRTWDDRP